MLKKHLIPIVLAVIILASLLNLNNVFQSTSIVRSECCSCKYVTGYFAMDRLLARLSGISYEDTVLSIASAMGINLSDQGIRYRLLYGGRVVKLYGDNLEKLGLIGARSDSIIFGAYVNGKWIILPFRVYVEKIENTYYLDDVKYTNYIHYMIQPVIDDRTTIEIRLPPYLPSTSDPIKDRPVFARGSVPKLFSLTVGDLKIPIYLFRFKNTNLYIHDLLYDYSYDYPALTGINSPFRTALQTPGLKLIHEKIDDIIRDLGLYENETETLLNILKDKAFEPLMPKSLEIIIDWPPDTPVPDGGGGGPSYDYVEARPLLFTERVIREGKRVPLTNVIFTSSSTSYSNVLYQVVPQYSWSIYNPLLEIAVVDLYVYGNKSTTRTLTVTIDGEEETYSVSGGSNIITIHKMYYPYKEADDPISYTISIEESLDPDEAWSISGTVRLYYDIDVDSLLTYQSKINGTCKFDVYTRLKSNLILSESNSYSYSRTVFMGSPRGGYILDRDMSNLGFNITIKLSIKGRVFFPEPPFPIRSNTNMSTENTYAWANISVKIYLGNEIHGEIHKIHFDTEGTKHYYVDIVLGSDDPYLSRLYHVLLYNIIRGRIPVTIKVEVEAGNLEETGAQLELEIEHYGTPFIGIVEYRPITYKYYNNQYVYTTLYKCIDYYCEISQKMHIPVYLSTGMYAKTKNSHGVTNVGDIALTFTDILAGDMLFNIIVDINPEPTNPFCLNYVCYDGQFEHIAIKLDTSSQQYFSFSGSYDFTKFDLGPGASLPDIELPGIIPGVASVIIDKAARALSSYITIFTLSLDGYKILRRSLMNDASCTLQNNGYAIKCDWTRGLMAPCSDNPLEIYINNVYVETLDGDPPVYLKVCFDATLCPPGVGDSSMQYSVCTVFSIPVRPV